MVNLPGIIISALSIGAGLYITYKHNETFMNSFPKYHEGQTYTDEIKNSVRYGYMYRKEAESNVSPHASLADASDVLLWLASAIASGYVWDVVKSLKNRILRKCRKSDFFQDGLLRSVLTDEKEFTLFYNYIKEYNNRCMAITEKQFKFIREEIIADYYGKEADKILHEHHRLPTTEDYMRINREANAHADMVMSNSDFLLS